jgi:hypothetical protein
MNRRGFMGLGLGFGLGGAALLRPPADAADLPLPSEPRLGPPEGSPSPTPPGDVTWLLWVTLPEYCPEGQVVFLKGADIISVFWTHPKFKLDTCTVMWRGRASEFSAYHTAGLPLELKMFPVKG